jgi:hypothetical protein
LALLVGFAPPQGQHQPVAGEGKVGGVQRRQLRAAERGGEADQQQGAVAQGPQAVPRLRQRADGVAHDLDDRGLLLGWGGAVGAADALHHVTDRRVVGAQLVAGQPVRLPDRDQA